MTDEVISPLRRRMIEDMTIRKLAPKTQMGYIRHIKNFTTFLGRRAHTLPPHRRRSNPHSASRTAPILLPRFPPLEAFGRWPPAQAARHQCGRHPKPFTNADIANLSLI